MNSSEVRSINYVDDEKKKKKKRNRQRKRMKKRQTERVKEAMKKLIDYRHWEVNDFVVALTVKKITNKKSL